VINGGPFTAEEQQAFAMVFGYLEAIGERSHYERSPHSAHIWLDIVKAKAAVERVVMKPTVTKRKPGRPEGRGEMKAIQDDAKKGYIAACLKYGWPLPGRWKARKVGAA
jgi:hypothetical protein